MYDCPVCGFSGLDQLPFLKFIYNSSIYLVTPPYFISYGKPSYEVCSCCGFEFGNDDNPGTSTPISFEGYYKEWVEDGCKWFENHMRPKNWDHMTQKNLFLNKLRGI